MPINIVAGVSYPPVQMVFGDPATDQAIFVDATHPLPVTISGGTISGTVALDSSTLTALELIGVKGADGALIASAGNPIPVTISSGFPATIAVTQSTSPWVIGDGGGSITVDGAVAVSWGAAQHIIVDSGSVNVGNFPATQAVTGTFWQATQPVSGTFFQATQPVSGTVTANQGTAGASAWPVVLPGLATITDAQVSVGTSQVAIPTTNLANRKSISIKALAANGANVYVGLTGVSSTVGFELAAGDSIDIDADATVNLFGIAASGTQRVSVMEIA